MSTAQTERDRTELTSFPAVLFILSFLAFIVTPGHPAGFTDGLPLKPHAITALICLPALAFAFWRGMSSRWTLLAASLIILLTSAKVLLSMVSPEYGLSANYYENSRFNGKRERSTEYATLGATRLDRDLDFGGDEFPLFFFNDSERFNFYGAGSPQRRQLPFSIRWSGIVLAPSDGTYTFRLTASGPAAVTVGTDGKLSVNAEGRASAERAVQLSAGPNPITAEYSRRPERSPDFRIEWTGAGQLSTLKAPYLRPTDSGPDLGTDAVLANVARGIDVIALAAALSVFALAAGRVVRGTIPAPSWRNRLSVLERPILGLTACAFALEGTIPRIDRFGKMVYLGGGQDWLLHETLARDIQLNGPLMTLGKALGEGRTFYAQPFYPYALAVFHAILGEDQFGVTAIQVAMLGVTCVLIWELTRALFDPLTAWVGFSIAVVFSLFELDWVARRLLSENIYFVVMPAFLLSSVVTHRTASAGKSALTGMLLGVATLTRGTTLLLVPVLAVLLARRNGLRYGLILMMTTIAIVLLVPMRNALVAGRPAVLATSGGVNMEKFHRPSDVVRLARVDDNPVYNRLGLDKPTREVLEYIRQDPLHYAQDCLILAAYTIGFGNALDEAQVPLYPDLIAFTIIYLLTVAFSRRARSEAALYVHAFIAVHFLAMIIFTPYDYENRLVLPMFLPMLSFVAWGVVSFLRVLLEKVSRKSEIAAPVTASALASHGE